MAIQIHNYMHTDGKITRSIHELSIPGSVEISNQRVYTLVSNGEIFVKEVAAGRTEYFPQHLNGLILNDSCA